MLLFFRNNQFTTLITLAVYTVLLRGAVYFLAPGTAEAPGPSGGPLYQATTAFLGADARLSVLAAAVLVLVQAVWLNALADKYRLLEERSWFPAVFYVFTASCLPSFLFLSPPLVAATFLLPALDYLFRGYKAPDASGIVFDGGFWIAVAGLFYPRALWLLPAMYFGFITMRAMNMREHAALLTGAASPYLLAWLWQFWFDRGGEFVDTHFRRLFVLPEISGDFPAQMLWQIGFVGALVLLMLISFGIYYHKKLIYAQKCITALYIFLLTTGLSVVLQPQLRPEHTLLAAPAFGVFLALNAQSFRRRWAAEIFHLVLVLVVVMGMLVFGL